MNETFHRIISQAVAMGWSDVHITGGHAVVYRKDGDIGMLRDTVLAPADVDDLARSLLNPHRADILRRRWSVDFAHTVAGIRVRVNIFNTTRGLSLAVRLLAGRIPTLAHLNLHPSLEEFTRLRAGLILVCGATGSGKTTTMAAMLDEINRNRPAHIITLEDPIEYRFASKKAFVEQRELGAHFPSFERGLLDVLREDPDVILVGELREAETIRLALSAAESGHLVIASLHSATPEEALYRLCNAFPLEAQELVRHQLSSTLHAVVVQQLRMHPVARFRVPVLSLLIGSHPVRMLVREGKFAQLHSIVEMGRGEGMYTMDAYYDDYLNRPQRFSAPSNVFRPAPEEEQLPDHESPLVDRGLGTTHYAPEAARHLARTGVHPAGGPLGDAAPSGPFGPSGASAVSGTARTDEHGETVYTLTDEGRLEDVLREFASR
ncbi:PilT/PilU family type 4a pilus ATPase [Nitratidesulfovibrio sp.]|uniref:type IV pilus twitching motility protein PilT n=1 Tax=Nitratidesulfovibrio sp. TaxID=2802297 RepID=UPI00333FDCB4